MSKPSFIDSQKNGKHYQLNQLIGEWEGSTKTWFEPDKLTDESPWRGKMYPILNGRFIAHEYHGSLQGKPFEGFAIYGYDLSSDTFQCTWVDSFHMSTAMMFSEGKPVNNGFSVLGSYNVPGMNQRWGWRTEIEPVNENQIIITSYNISPQGEEAKGIETIYHRIGGL